MSRLRYTAVIATRNRPDALALSVPLLQAQTEAPAEVVIVDSSDDPSQNAELARRLDGEYDVAVRFLESAAGSAYQRMLGLAEVETDVVLFPDDDSLLFPDAMAHIMRVYERDEAGVIGGVCAAEETTPPPELQNTLQGAYRRRSSDSLRSRFALSRFALEDRFVPDVFPLIAERKQARLPALPDWLDEETAFSVPFMTGFRMSFRTEMIRDVGFNDKLGRYALFEDTDACFRVLDSRHLVAAWNAKIYHHKAPARRAGGVALGAMQILNRAYIVAASGEMDSKIRKRTLAFCRYKIFQYFLGTSSQFGRDRFLGAKRAYPFAKRLLMNIDPAPDVQYLEGRRLIFGSAD